MREKTILLIGSVCIIALMYSVSGNCGSTTGGGRFYGGAAQYAQSTSQPTSSQKDTTQNTSALDNDNLTVNEIKIMQEKLNQLGFNCGTADGIVGTKTIEAVKQYERSKGMTAEGKVSRELYNTLMKDKDTLTIDNDDANSNVTAKTNISGAFSKGTCHSKTGNASLDSKSSYTSQNAGEVGENLFNALQNAFNETAGMKNR